MGQSPLHLRGGGPNRETYPHRRPLLSFLAPAQIPDKGEKYIVASGKGGS